MSYDARYVTAVHEAGHAVISHLLGRPISHAILYDDQKGEVVPNCSHTDDEVKHYIKENPEMDNRSRRIQQEIRCDCGIAVSGLISEEMICGATQINTQEFQRDQELSRSKAAFLHLWTFGACCNTGDGRGGDGCSVCNEYLKNLRKLVKKIISKPTIRDAIEKLAQRLKDLGKMNGEEIKDFLNKPGVAFGSEVREFLRENVNSSA